MSNYRIPFPVKVLLAAVLLINTGTFMIMPFLAIHLTNDLHFKSWEVGTVLTVILIAQRGLPVVTGFIGDRMSHTVNVILGVMVRAVGFGLFVFADNFELNIIAAFFMGFGGALFDPSVTSFFTTQQEEIRKRVFTYFNQMLNAGVILGPLISAVLLKFNPVYPFSIASMTMVVLAVVLFLYRHQYPRTIKDEQKALSSFKSVFSNKHFIIFICIMPLFWIMFAQLNVTFPIKAYDLSGNRELVSSIFIVNGISGLLLMFLLRKLFINNNPITMVKFGMLIMAAAIGMIPIIPSIYWMLFCIFLYTLGETMALPGSEMTVAQFSEGKPAGLYFGIFQAFWAIGGTIGNYLGAWLNHFNQRAWSWLVFFSIGFIAFVLVHLLQQQLKCRTSVTVINDKRA